MIISDLKSFSGANREELRAFIAQLKLKVSLFPDEQSPLRYAISCLEGLAIDLFLPFLNNDHINFDNIQFFIDDLEATYGEPDRESTA